MNSLPLIKTAVPGPKSLQLSERLSHVESPDTTFLSPDFPIFWESAHGCIVYDVDGNSFLDATSSFGALSVGHTHPEIVNALLAQSTLLIHGMGDVHPSRVKVELLEAISRYSPIPDSRIILGQSGADAVEAALKTALLTTGKSKIVAFQGGYHGLTYGAIEPTARGYFRDPFVAHRGRFASHLPFGCELATVDDMLSLGEFGAVIVEPIQGRGGIRIPPEGWLKGLSQICKQYDAVLIVDEIYTGWGRTGRLFAVEWDQVIPDLICVGKAMGGGMPISACIGSSDLICRAWPKSTGEALHTSTFLGHPLACVAALAAISVIINDDLVNSSAKQGDALLLMLQQLAQKYPNLIVEVRGRGLMIGIELINRQHAVETMLACLRGGLIVLPAGDDGNVIELTPPLIINNQQIAWVVKLLDSVFKGI